MLIYIIIINYSLLIINHYSFLAILIITRYNSLPQRKMYWENSDDVSCPAIANTMSRNRFEELMSVIHLADNQNLIEGDKMAKLRPYYDLLNHQCRNLMPNRNNKSVDESMIPYYGRNSSKQRIQNKPVRVGYKMWVMAETSGYVIDFDVYQGAKNGASAKSSSTSWGLGEKVVLRACETLPQDHTQHIFMDNFFTSFRLLKHLKNHKIYATGTIRKNKLNDCPIIKAEALKKESRGHYDQRTSADGSFTVVGWNDNRPVYVASNCERLNPVNGALRWSSSEKKGICLAAKDYFGIQQRYGRSRSSRSKYCQLPYINPIEEMVVAFVHLAN